MTIDDLLKNLTVLFVEDDQPSREIFSRLLSTRVGCVHQAANGQDGLKMFCQFNPDVVITDLEMPIMNGMDMIRSIRDLGYKTPIIITTGYIDDEHSTDLANHTLIKPVVFSRLVEAIEECIPEQTF
jgi:YesN/AraC family two-component response regulator